jgi:hypothetical protein
MSSIIKVDQIQLSDGSTPTAGDLGLNTTGSVLQVVNQRWTTQSVNTTTSYANATNGALTFTPKSANSKLLILSSISIYINSGDAGAGLVTRFLLDGIPRDQTGDQYENFYGFGGVSSIAVYNREHKQLFLNNSSTSEQTLQLQFRKYSTNDPDATINANNQFYSYITLLEIAG